MFQFLISYLYYITWGFEVVGVLVILLGMARVLNYTLKAVMGGFPQKLFDVVRVELGRSIILSLEFFVAGDIIRTVIAPDYYEVGLLAILVAIRTIMTFFLNMEIEQVKRASDGTIE